MEPVFELVFENPNFEATFEPEEKLPAMSRTCLWIKVGKKMKRVESLVKENFVAHTVGSLETGRQFQSLVLVATWG